MSSGYCSYENVGITFNSNYFAAKCASPVAVLLTLALFNIITISSGLVLGSEKFQTKLRWFRKDEESHDRKWTPLSGICMVFTGVVAAAITAVAFTYSGFRAETGQVMLLWFLRPRAAWTTITYYTVFGKQYKKAATDSVFFESIMSILAMPMAISLIAYAHGGGDCIHLEMHYPYSESKMLQGVAVSGIVTGGAIYPFCFAALLWFRSLSRPMAGLAAFLSFFLYVFSWIFWISFLNTAGRYFCPTNLAAASLFQAVVPFLNAIARSWIGNTGGLSKSGRYSGGGGWSYRP